MPRVSRRTVLNLLGGGAGFGLASFLPGRVVEALAIIRTVLKDLSPADLGSGALLFHEHVGADTIDPMRNVTLRSILPVLLTLCGGSLLAQNELAPLKDLPQTIGSASRTSGPFMLCAFPDAGLIRAAYAAAGASRKPFAVGWELRVDPIPALGKVLVITNLPKTGSLASANCKVVQPLPPGGADAIELHQPYAAVDKATDWGVGYTSLVMTTKNDTLAASDYVPRLKRHVRLVTQLFEPKGLDGYIVYCGESYEWAYLHWTDRETSNAAFATPDGRTGPQDSASFQHSLGTSTQILPADLGK
jgi:hypothetical protein